ncbi:helix-turn-helix transcriptional regulator [Agrococcus baldri]|uniref:DNA-binding response regulator, NarL/FixJ family, contains REC and HTH domains n=1 Tax=Agrococcus baldri TaxID=153730 RepID=A0AA87RFD3_9MICO|nr:sigma-70 region 4 domain-containing protein [Agrococcus baldri]GEK79511.1 hypothetical protein ABA31_08620 [Agrococcus baldri]
MAVTAAENGSPRSVSIVACGSLGARLRDAVEADAALRLSALAPRFTDLVVDPGFPGDAVVLAEEPGRQLFVHAVTAAAAGAIVVVHADTGEELRLRLEEAGAIVVPLAETAATVAERVAAARTARRRGGRSNLDAAHRRPRLSPGERRALAHYVQGLTTVQVAAEMGVGYETAKTFLRRVRAKYAAIDRPAGTRIELSLRADEDGIL